MSQNSKSILFHASTIEVRQPLTNVGRKELDFGPGFYLTEDYAQAVKWAQTVASRKKGDKVISTVDAYVDGFINAEQALDRLVNEELRHQVCISRQEIVDRFLKFMKSEEI